jgi:quinol monooxygenase YgiN
MIKRLVKLTFRADKTDEFIQIFEESKQKILAREGCLHVELLRGIAPETVFFTFSIWESEAALDAYRHSDLFVETWAKTKALFSERAEAWSLNAVSSAEHVSS